MNGITTSVITYWVCALSHHRFECNFWVIFDEKVNQNGQNFELWIHDTVQFRIFYKSTIALSYSLKLASGKIFSQIGVKHLSISQTFMIHVSFIFHDHN